MRSAVAIYLIYAAILVISGIYIASKITDTSDPSSLGSSLKRLEDVINENSEIP